jgi:4,5-DOPA dioxygenase extradiol
MPALFVGHGNPMNAIEDNRFSRAWKSLGAALPRPVAILVVSAHWSIPATAVTGGAHPRTIHDFSNFPAALYQVQYPASGDPQLASEIAALLAPVPVALDTAWGIDHGAWSVLLNIFPNADVPVIQLSIDETQPPQFHYDLGVKLGALRDRGVLVMGSGNVVHNLEWFQPGGAEPYDWAVRFDDFVRDAVERHDDSALIDYKMTADQSIAAPDAEHYLPLLYIAGARSEDDGLQFIVEGFDAKSISMRSFRLG